MTSPGARKVVKGTPSTSPRLSPQANANTAMSKSAVTTGASTVWT